MNELHLPKEGSPEFEAEMRQIQEQLVKKFAWTAQHDGIIYKLDPTSLKPMDDHTFNRVSRAKHSFLYLNKSGKRFMIDALQRLLQKDGFGQHGRNLKELSAVLEVAGVVQARPMIDGKRVRLYRLPDVDGQVAKAAEIIDKLGYRYVG